MTCHWHSSWRSSGKPSSSTAFSCIALSVTSTRILVQAGLCFWKHLTARRRFGFSSLSIKQ
ncbi:hypothetical protein PF010_g13620 [Phytophthora fragariae]|uniref:Uncharacterized protein n=1 Tax=Phytophthora fragariae TaxID=53985 RepID=A0A6A3EWC9_9STRA|nr:hypothetical protein PF003_g8463 [Phytophthora fragariae]KAE8937804.1 hypothetical protein PF009_g12295 [Phytophthora fragariae]KAE9101666.1 hypothetical protein PF007_g15052 [Phytophthora fragariae]KAE9103763.1 hypothetical protein PF010_g13620 [Phytophthora fragariae]KAE9104487.1 hypothetical protein PF006_g21891 [Phytophthora fragariae]